MPIRGIIGVALDVPNFQRRTSAVRALRPWIIIIVVYRCNCVPGGIQKSNPFAAIIE